MRSPARRFGRLHAATACAATLVGVGTLAGCGGPPKLPDGAMKVLKPVRQVPASAGNSGPFGPTDFYRVKLHRGRVPSDLIAMPWTAVGVSEDSEAIAVTWDFGACGNKDFDVYVDESPSAVIIDVWNDPAFDGACTDQAFAAGPSSGSPNRSATVRSSSRGSNHPSPDPGPARPLGRRQG